MANESTNNDITVSDYGYEELDYKTIFETTGTGMALIESNGTFSLVNNKILQILETDMLGIMSTQFSDWVFKEDKAMMDKYHLARFTGNKNIPENYECRLVSKNNHTYWVLINLKFFKNTGRTLVSVLDISDLKQTEQALKEAVASQDAIFGAVPDLMFELDANGYYLNVWANNDKELAASKKQLLGNTVSEILPHDAAKRVMTAIREASEKGQSFGQQIQIDTPDGKLWFELSVSLKNNNSSIHHFIVLSRNITERKQMEAKLIYLSNHDYLTGLYNRRMLEKQLDTDIKRANRYKHSLSLFMLDIDKFKIVNDTRGHSVGDLVLEKVSEVLKETIREMDYASRYGGEEFVVVLPETPLEKAEKLAERLRSKIEKTIITTEDGDKFNITVSIGVSSLTDKTKSLDTLLNLADSAMYFAKNSGRNCIRLA